MLTITAWVLNLLDGTISGCIAYRGSLLEQLGSTVGRVGWSSLAQISWNCVLYLYISGGVNVVLLSISYQFKCLLFNLMYS